MSANNKKNMRRPVPSVVIPDPTTMFNAIQERLQSANAMFELTLIASEYNQLAENQRSKDKSLQKVADEEKRLRAQLEVQRQAQQQQNRIDALRGESLVTVKGCYFYGPKVGRCCQPARYTFAESDALGKKLNISICFCAKHHSYFVKFPGKSIELFDLIETSVQAYRTTQAVDVQQQLLDAETEAMEESYEEEEEPLSVAQSAPAPARRSPESVVIDTIHNNNDILPGYEEAMDVDEHDTDFLDYYEQR